VELVVAVCAACGAARIAMQPKLQLAVSEAKSALNKLLR
jgi:hypothetical protein